MPAPVPAALPVWDRLLPVSLFPGRLVMAGAAPAVDAAPWGLLCRSHPRSPLLLGQDETGSDEILPFPQGLWGCLREHAHALSPSDQLEQCWSAGTTAAPVALHPLPQTDRVVGGEQCNEQGSSGLDFSRIF